MSNNPHIISNGREKNAFPTMPRQVRELLTGQCDSVTLDLQKFPDLTDRVKKAELQAFCQKVKNCKKYISSSLLLPEIQGSISFVAKNKGRLLVNHTGGIVENSNISLHRFFGCPTIPGSALKGIARNAARFDEDIVRFDRVFGGVKKGKSDKAGSVAFLMAIPDNNNWDLVVDILTSHGGTETKNPVPVFFPAVEKGAMFRFVIAPTARCEDGDLEFAAKYLKLALAEQGAGAKTAAGYGWFEIVEN